MSFQQRVTAPATQEGGMLPRALPRRTRRDRIRALQLYLRQIHESHGTWSDGRQVYTGKALDELRDRLVNQLIQTRAEAPASPNGQAWRNLALLMQAQGNPHAAPLIERMTQQLRQASAAQDHGAKERARVLRRALRRRAKREFEQLPIEVKATPKETAYLMAELIQTMIGFNRLMPVMSTTLGLEGAAGSIVGQLFDAIENPFEYTPEQEVRRGLRPADQHA